VILPVKMSYRISNLVLIPKVISSRPPAGENRRWAGRSESKNNAMEVIDHKMKISLPCAKCDN
jgi:hypothetical protein